MHGQNAKKLVLFSATFGLMTEASKIAKPKTLEENKFQQVLYIPFLAQYDRFSMEALIDLGSKINVMQPNFIRKQGFRIYKTNMDPPKIDNSRLNIYKMVILLF